MKFPLSKKGTYDVMEPIATVTAPLWLPFAIVGALIYKTTEDIPQPDELQPTGKRPFEGCCFVWIQEDETGLVVAGEKP